MLQLHLLLHGVEPAVWRRLRVRDDTTLAALHALIQIAFAWRDASPHVFILRGKLYGARVLVDMLSDDIPLGQLGLRPKERFTYRYGAWSVQVRWEAALVCASPTPACVAGAGAGPSERSQSPNEYADRLARREQEMPWDERHFMIASIAKFADAQPGQSVREVIGDMEAFAQAVARVRAYEREDPNRFERRVLNQRFQAFDDGDPSWRNDDEDDDSPDNRWD